MIKLWHDDIRRAPEGWLWARTNAAAIVALHTGRVEACSLDHDLGLHDLNPADYDRPEILKGTSEVTGVDLVEWMIRNNRVPPKVSIHSWNPEGARRMAALLNDAGYDCAIIPFTTLVYQVHP